MVELGQISYPAISIAEPVTFFYFSAMPAVLLIDFADLAQVYYTQKYYVGR